MSTKADVIAELEKAGVAHDPNATKAELEALLPKDGGDNGDAGAGDGAAANGAAVKGGKGIYYRVKVKSYINDTKTVDAGLYFTKKPIERFEGQSAAYIEKYEDTLPEVVIFDIARSLMIKTDDGKGKLRAASDILAEIATEL